MRYDVNPSTSRACTTHVWVPRRATVCAGCALPGRWSLPRQQRPAARIALGGRADPRAHPHRGAVAAAPGGRRAAPARRPAQPRRPRAGARRSRALRMPAPPPRSRPSSAHQSRRQGGRVLRARAAARRGRLGRDAGAGALRLHLRGHQQPQLRAAAAARRASRCQEALQARIAELKRSRSATPTSRCWRAPTASRPARPRSARSARISAPGWSGPRAAGSGGDPGQVERRGRQLQCARGRAARARLAAGGRDASCARCSWNTTP